MPNPGPNIQGMPNSMQESIAVGSNIVYTFATLPAASGFAPGFLAITSDQGLCVVEIVNGIYTWVPVGHGSLTVEAGTNSVSSGTVSFANSNGVTFGMNTAGVITATVTPGAAAGIAALQLSNTTYTSGTAVFQNANGISFGSSGANGISASYNSTQFAGTGTTFAGTNVSATLGLNSNGLALSISSPTETGVGLSAAGSSQTAGNIVFSNSNNVSFGMNGSTVTASAAGGGIDVTLGGNTSGALALVSTGTLFLAGGNNITLSQNGNSVTVSGANAGGAQTGISGLQVSNTTYSSGTVTFQNANGISFGSSGANGISASYNSTQFAGIGTTFNGANVSGSLTLNSAGLNLSLSAGAGGGASTGGIYAAGNTTGQSSSSTYPISSLNLSLAGILSGGWSSNTFLISSPGTTALQLSGYAVSNTTQSSSGTLAGSALSFAGAGGVSVGVSNGTVVISGAAAGGASTVGLYGLGNTTQNSSTTLNQSALSFNGLGEITVGYSNGSIQLSAPPSSIGVSNIGNTLGNTGTYSGQMILAGGNNITMSVSSAAGGAQTITVVGASQISTVGLYALGNTTQNSSTTLNQSALSFDALGAMTMGYSNGSIQVSAPATSSISATGMASVSVNGSTISIGAAIPQLSFFQPLGPVQSTTVTQNGLGSVQVYPAIAAFPFTASRVDMMASVSLAALAASTEAQTLSMYVGLYSLNGSTLSLASSGSQSYAWTNNSGGSSASLSGIRRFSAPINVNYTGGFDLFVGMMTNTTFANTNGISLSNVVMPLGPGPQLQGLIGQTQVNSMQFVPGQGFYSASSAGLPSSMGLSQILGAGSGGNAVDYYAPVQFVNMTA